MGEAARDYNAARMLKPIGAAGEITLASRLMKGDEKNIAGKWMSAKVVWHSMLLGRPFSIYQGENCQGVSITSYGSPAQMSKPEQMRNVTLK